MRVDEVKARLAAYRLLQVAQDVCDAHYVPLDIMLAGSRAPSVSRARAAFIDILSAPPYRRAQAEISHLLGIDRTTVTHALRKAADARAIRLRVCEARAALRVA